MSGYFYSQLLKLTKLRSGWYGGNGNPEGRKPVSEALQIAKDLYDSLPRVIGEPDVFPTLEGGVGLEWELYFGYDVSVEIDPIARTIELHIQNTKSNDCVEYRVIDIDDDEGTDIIRSKIRDADLDII